MMGMDEGVEEGQAFTTEYKSVTRLTDEAL